MHEEPRKICPLLGSGPVEINTDCKEDRCAWWDDAEQRCVLHVVRKTLDNIADVLMTLE